MAGNSSNKWIGLGLTVIVVGMIGMSFAAVPLYRVFCEATGYGGTPDISGRAAPGAEARKITVAFVANTNPNLPWDFHADIPSVTLPLGQDQLAYYHARNKSGGAITGVAVYNVTPEKVGKYFHKTACFCFDEQTLKAGQEQEFPLSFWVDPAIANDPNTADVTTITLSYTFFRAADDAARTAALVNAGPHVGKLVQ